MKVYNLRGYSSGNGELWNWWGEGGQDILHGLAYKLYHYMNKRRIGEEQQDHEKT